MLCMFIRVDDFAYVDTLSNHSKKLSKTTQNFVEGSLRYDGAWKSNPRVTSSDPRVTSSNLTSSNPRVTGSNPRVMSCYPRVRRLKARVATLKARVGRLQRHELGD